jgi:hypothetical protein
MYITRRGSLIGVCPTFYCLRMPWGTLRAGTVPPSTARSCAQVDVAPIVREQVPGSGPGLGSAPVGMGLGFAWEGSAGGQGSGGEPSTYYPGLQQLLPARGSV